MHLNRLFISLVIGALVYSGNGFSQNADNTDKYLAFQVIQDQVVFDNSNIKNASLIQQNNSVFVGLEIELKAAAAENFIQLTKANAGKKINIIFNKRVVASTILQSPLSNKILITGITKFEAQDFLNELTVTQQKIDYQKAQEEAERQRNELHVPPPIVQDVLANS